MEKATYSFIYLLIIVVIADDRPIFNVDFKKIGKVSDRVFQVPVVLILENDYFQIEIPNELQTLTFCANLNLLHGCKEVERLRRIDPLLQRAKTETKLDPFSCILCRSYKITVSQTTALIHGPDERPKRFVGGLITLAAGAFGGMFKLHLGVYGSFHQKSPPVIRPGSYHWVFPPIK